MEPPQAKVQEKVVAKEPVEPVPGINGENGEKPANAGEAKPQQGASNNLINNIVGGAGSANALENVKDTAVVKEITEVATPEEIPSLPDELGISIEDTNPR
ncbi:MAG: hypothetical protein GX811_08795 [Lentisphaerae bacterium]|nr:hypothetical protein [Lentisphaerota bacterium]